MSRNGQALSTLTFTQDPGDTQAISDKRYEGVAMDDGILYVTTENGGSIAFP